MRPKNVRSKLIRLRLWAGLFALAGVSLSHAAGGFQNVSKTGGATINWDQSLISENIGWTPSVINTSTGPAFKTSPTISVNGKNTVIDVVAKVPRSSAATAAKKLLSALPGVGTVIALADLAKWASSEMAAEDFQIGANGVHQILKKEINITASRCNSTGSLLGGGDLSGLATECGRQILQSYDTTGTTSVVAGPDALPTGGYYTHRYTIQTYKTTGQIWVSGYVDVVQTLIDKWEPVTTQQVADAIAAKSGWPQSDIAKSAMASSLTQALKYADTPIAAETPTVSGPSSVTGTPEISTTTSINPDGTTSTTTVTKTPTHNITYEGNTANYQTTYVTTTNVTNNSTNQTTTTTTTTQEAPAAEKADPTPSECEKNPDIIGCSKYGTAESDTLNKETRVFEITPTVFASSASCPQPLNFTVFGNSYGVSYQPLCDVAVYLKVLFLAIAGVMAAYILADSFRVQ